MKAPTVRRLDKHQLMALLGIVTEETLRRYIDDGLIPSPVRIGKNPSTAQRFWLEHEVVEFLERAAADSEKLDDAKHKRDAGQRLKRDMFYARLAG